MEKEIEDEILGTVLLRVSTRARHYSLKIKNGKVIAVMPAGGDEAYLLDFLRKKRLQLQKELQERPAAYSFFDENTSFETQTFRLNISRTDRANFYVRLWDGVLYITCPSATDFRNGKVQALLRGFIEKALRHEAGRMLPVRLRELALRYNFTYKQVRITKSKTRWGSCSGSGNINLSLSLMLLPRHLSDYVLLHELCHTREMNHSDRFWELMNKVTNGKARALRHELKTYHVFSPES